MKIIVKGNQNEPAIKMGPRGVLYCGNEEITAEVALAVWDEAPENRRLSEDSSELCAIMNAVKYDAPTAAIWCDIRRGPSISQRIDRAILQLCGRFV